MLKIHKHSKHSKKKKENKQANKKPLRWYAEIFISSMTLYYYVVSKMLIFQFN